MSEFYNTYRRLYEMRFVAGAAAADPGKIEALKATLAQMELVLHGLQEANRTAQNAGQDRPDLVRELKRTVFMTGAIRDLLIEAEDGSEEIKAAKAAIDQVNKKLGKLKKDAESIAKGLGTVSTVLDEVAKVMTFIKGA